ncbi:F-box-like domain-containing protein [Microdochium nivale]|nr:F-box-like domain-containing protein [Microdochium nivale]
MYAVCQAAPVADLTHLPNDVFLLIISYLSPSDGVLCRRVSRSWHSAFSSDGTCHALLRWHFPRCRELRREPNEPALEAPYVSPPTSGWSHVFPAVARRYHHLRMAKPRIIEKIDVVQESKDRGPHRGVEPWNRWLDWNGKSAAFQHRDPTWTLDNGLLVYREKVSGRYVAYDLETRHRYSIPFDASDKIVRRIRLACGVLVIEWCEREPHHQLNDREAVHRHFATAYDVHRPSSRSTSPKASVVRSDPPPTSWHITFRSEWKIHFLGLPINRHDRFYSAHTATHYALYLWQPNRSPWGEEDPLEQLTVWDISFPSAYLPSQDPSGANHPDPDLAPFVVRRFSWRDLVHLGVRQRHTPCMREIMLDDSNVYIHEEEHRWLSGQHSSLSPPRHHFVRSTGIPFHGPGPCWVDECCADGDVHMSFCPRAGSAARFIDTHGSTKDAIKDEDNDFPNEARGNNMNNWASTPTEGGAGYLQNARPLPGTDSAQDADPMWPGWAPCWRHEEFPYLTVSDMVDSAAGVRIVARQCFVMEALSAFVMPRICIDGGEASSASHASAKKSSSDCGSSDADEARFEDSLWTQLLGKGKIVGDERWIVGEDAEGRVTIARF